MSKPYPPQHTESSNCQAEQALQEYPMRALSAPSGTVDEKALQDYLMMALMSSRKVDENLVGLRRGQHPQRTGVTRLPFAELFVPTFSPAHVLC